MPLRDFREDKKTRAIPVEFDLHTLMYPICGYSHCLEDFILRIIDVFVLPGNKYVWEVLAVWLLTGELGVFNAVSHL